MLVLIAPVLSVNVNLIVSIPGVAFDYELPFHGLVPSDPSFEDMKRIVVIERRQPTIPSEWIEDTVCAMGRLRSLCGSPDIRFVST